ncbi:MAG: C1 family peptidase [Alphaproteobacteria bacterium]
MSAAFEPSDEHGLIERDYFEEPVGTVCGAFDGNYIPRSEWPDLIKKHKDRRSRPIDFHRFANVPILDQGKTKYCWAFSVVAGVMNRLAFQGINRPVPHLSATAVAAVGLNFRNQGGHCSQAVKLIQEQGGIPSVHAWPQQSLDKSLKNSEKVLESRMKNQLTDFVDCGRDLDAAISLMLGETPLPCTFSLPWWRHAVLGLEVLDRGEKYGEKLDRFGVRFVNSYSNTWQSNGYGTFYGDKMLAWEYVGISHIKPRKENDRSS